MKYFLPCVCTLFIVINLIPIKGLSQNNQPTDNSYYVVIGAFANPKNAIEFTERAKKKNYKAEYSLNVSRNLYYVYILSSPDRTEAITLAITLQKSSAYNDTWVYQGLLGENPQVVKIQENERQEILAKVEEQRPIETPLDEPKKEVKPDDGTRKFIFRLRSLSTGEDVIGDVDVFDADLVKARKSASYRGNDTVSLKPINKSGNLAVVCDVFGYRKLQLSVNMANPQPGDGVAIEGNVIVMTFELVRLKKGDVVTMYNVYFFKDAAVMRPESRYEVNALVDFMKESDKAKIRIHGHTNGSRNGKIISMGSSKDFFGLSTQNKEGVGSAMKLSEERAKLIRSYLVNQGVDESRMEVKAWGGKRPIYDEDHPSAAANVRVEIEVLED